MKKKRHAYALVFHPLGSGWALDRMQDIFWKRGHEFSISVGQIFVWGSQIEIDLTIKNAELPLHRISS